MTQFPGNKRRFQTQIIVKLMTAIVLMSISVNQAAWLNNMYELYTREFKLDINWATQQAINIELAERTETIGGYSVYSVNIAPPNDSSRYFTKNVVTEDSTYTFTIDKNDPNVMAKIVQFVLAKYFPIDLEKLTAISREKIKEKHDVERIYFDYLDLNNKLQIESTRPVDISTVNYVKTDTISLDIVASIGVVGYIQNSHLGVLNKMRKQLAVSLLLILIALIAIFYISKSFVVQWKTERMRQESVNAMTHELNRPISSAVAMTSLIPFYLERGERGRALEYVKSIEMDLNKLTQYTKRIQQISNNEKQYVMMNRTEVEIVPFFKSLQKRYAVSEDHQRKVILNLMVETAKQVMCVDMLHFSNVMDNLVENAIKYTVATPVIIIIDVTDTTNDELKISVTDNGIGISTADKKQIFDRFYRVNRTETKGKTGFGLGLTYVKSIVEAHGGTISVSSELNKGSEFVIIFQG